MGQPRLYLDNATRQRAYRERQTRPDRGTDALQTFRALSAGGEPYIEVAVRKKGDGTMTVVAGAFRPNVPSGRSLDHTVTVLGRLYIDGIITAAQRAAGDRFRDLHMRRYGSPTAAAANMEPRIPGAGDASPEALERQERAERGYRDAEMVVKRLGWKTLSDVLDAAVYDLEPEWRAVPLDELGRHALDRHRRRLLDGLDALVAFWRMAPRGEGSRIEGWMAAE